MREAGKGSKPRPLSVDQQTFDANWEKIFGSAKVRKEIEEQRKLKDPRTDAERQKEAWMKDEYYDLED